MKEDINYIVYKSLIKKANELSEGMHHNIKDTIKINGKEYEFGCEDLSIKSGTIEIYKPFAYIQ